MAITPAVTATLIKSGFNVHIETGAGLESKFRDAEYAAAGASIVPNARAAYEADILLKVRQPLDAEVDLLREHSTLISFLYPGQNRPLIDRLGERKINAFGRFQDKKEERDVPF